MTPKRSIKTAAAPVRIDTSQSDSQDASQDSGLAVGQMAKTFGDQVKKKTVERRQTKTAAINTAHDDRIGKLRTDVQACFEDHDIQLRALRRPNVERLIKLARKKRELEAKIDQCQSELARSFEEAAQQLQASVDGRVEVLSTSELTANPANG